MSSLKKKEKNYRIISSFLGGIILSVVQVVKQDLINARSDEQDFYQTELHKTVILSINGDRDAVLETIKYHW